MKALFWVSPVTELNLPLQKKAWVTAFVPRVLAALRESQGEVEATIAVSEDVALWIERESVAIQGRVVALAQRELLDGYRVNALLMMKDLQRGVFRNDDITPLLSHVRMRLGGDYNPDVIVAFGPSAYLRKLYPGAQLFHHEYSVFSRAPYPETWTFDPVGVGYRFSLASEAATINAIPTLEEERCALADYRSSVREALAANRYVTEYFCDLRKRYDRILLFPLGYESHYETLLTLPHQGQFEVVEQILDSVSEKTCVIVTQHPARPAVLAEGLDELRGRHPNLEFQEWYLGVPGFSQIALVYVDVCACLNTSLAYQAAFLNCRLVSLDGFCAGIADATEFEALESVCSATPMNRDGFILWSLKHYAISAPDMARQLACYFQKDIGCLQDSGRFVAEVPEILCEGDLLRRLSEWKSLARDFGAELSQVGAPVSQRERMRRHVEDLEIEREALFADRDRIIADCARLTEERDRLLRRYRIPQRLIGLLSHCLRWAKGFAE